MESATGFEQPDPALLAPEVGHQIRNQAAQKGRPHHGHLAGNRVGQADQIGVGREVQFPGLFDEGEIDHFLIAAVDQQLADTRLRTLPFRLRQHRQRASWHGSGNVVVTVQAGDLFDQVLLDFDVEAPGRRLDQKIVAIAGERQPEPGKQSGDLRRRQWHAKHSCRACGTQAHRVACRHLGPRLDHRPGCAAADVDNQAGSPLDGRAGATEIDATLETVRGVGAETVAAGTPGDRLRRKEG